MVELYDVHGRPVPLGRHLGSGGEGAVFEVGGNGRDVAKVYHQPISADKAEKLRCMAAMASPDLTKVAAWPTRTLHKSVGGPIVGVILPRVTNHEEIHNLYSPAHRKLKYPNKDWCFLVHVAMNCAAAFHVVHGNSCVIGDVNQGNVLVSQQGTVFLIDCDSFQVHASGKLFLCEVGVPQYTPPELQGRSFRGVHRTVNQDLFGLAVLVFHLVLMGRHPFAGRFLGRGEMPLEKAISECRFAFSRSAASFQMARPPDTLPLEHLVPQLAPLFECAFCRGSEKDGVRPSAKRWYNALSALKTQLRVCGEDRGHKFPAQLPSCPWCELVNSGSPDFFISVTVCATTAEPFSVRFDVSRLWEEIQAVPRPQVAYVPTAQVSHRPVPAPPPSFVESSEGLTTLVRRVVAASVALTLAAIVFHLLAYFTIPIGLVFAIWWAILVVNSPFNKEKKRRRRFLGHSESEVQSLQAELQEAVAYYEREFSDFLNRLARTKDQLDRLKSEYESELRSLQNACQAGQLAVFLQGKFISDHKIEKIGPERQSMLASYGIETAYDIERNRIMQIPGFGWALAQVLVMWRQRIEAQFRFNPSHGIPVRERQKLNLKYVQIRRQLERGLRSGPGDLRGVLAKSNPALSGLSRRLACAESAVAQARADLAVME